jgi:hypothetical protein
MMSHSHRLSTKMVIEPLNDTNWETWSFMMEQYLTVNGLWKITDGRDVDFTRSVGHFV